MTLDELRTIIASSTSRDWSRIKATGPTYRDRFGSWSSPADGTSGVDHDSHIEVAVYCPDIDLTIAYGMPESQHDHDLSFKWSENFPDSEIRGISLADIFWHGSLVDRVNYVYVDGGRGSCRWAEVTKDCASRSTTSPWPGSLAASPTTRSSTGTTPRCPTSCRTEMDLEYTELRRGATDDRWWAPPFDWNVVYENEHWWNRQLGEDPWFVQVRANGIEVARVEFDDPGGINPA